MSMSPRGLGKGLSALIPSAGASIVPHSSAAPERAVSSGLSSGILVVPPEQIHPNPMQPRHEFTPTELDALTASVRAHGVLQPLVVTRRTDGGYELIAGERRLRAAKRAGLTAVPVVVRPGTLESREKLELAIVENVQREDLNPMDRAFAYAQLAEAFGLTQEDIATRVGIARSSVAHVLRLLTLPEDMQQALRDGRLSEGHAKVLLGIVDLQEQRAWFARILEGGVSVAQVSRETAVRAARPAGRRSRMQAANDPNVRAKELALQQRLGAKVAIAPAVNGGTITITYYDTEELDGIVRTITGSR